MEINSQPAVIDIEALLAPISEDTPAGESLQYSNTDRTYDEIRLARQADDGLNQGDWVTQVKVADFRRVLDLAKDALQNKTKDLQIGAWMGEALVKQHGFVGLRDGLILMRGLHERFWDTMFPEPDPEEPGNELEGRGNAVDFFDKQGAFALKEVSIASNGYNYFQFDESKRFDIPEDTSDIYDETKLQKINDLRAEAESQNKVTSIMWRRAKEATPRKFYEEIALTLQECRDEFRKLDEIVDEKFGRQTPGMGELKKTLEALQDTIKRILDEKRQAEPWESDNPQEIAEGEGGEAGEGGGQVMMAGGYSVAVGAIRSRQDALRTLSQVAEFFQKTEPHTPVSYLVKRAVKWGNMTFDQVMRELIKDETVIGQMNEMLGVDPNAEGYGDSEY